MPENLFVIYPMGLGGHHLAHLLSTDPKFIQVIDHSRYDNFKDHAYFGGNIVDDLTEDNIEQYTTQSRVWADPISSYLNVDSKLLSRIPNKSFLVMHFPPINSIMHQRLSKFNYCASGHAFGELTMLYDQAKLSKLFQEPFQQFFGIDPELLWSEDIAPLVAKVQHDAPIDLNLDLKLAQTLHSKWYKQVVKPFLN